MTGGPVHGMPKQASRVIRGIVSGGFGLIVRIVLQLTQVPIILSFWPIDRYGEWLLIATLPAFLALSAVGISTVAGNSVAAAMTAGKTPMVRSLFRGAWMLVTASNICLLAVCGLLLASGVATRAVHFTTISQTEGLQTIALTVLLVALRLQCGVSEVVFRARGRYGELQMIETFAQIAEFAGLVISLYFFGSMVAAAASMVIVRGIMLCGLLVRLGLYDRWIFGEGDRPGLAVMRELVRPSFSYLLFPIAQFVQFEGTTLLIGGFFGPREVATYVSLRTYSRMADMLLNMVHNIMQAETGYLAGSANKVKLSRILALGTVFCLLLATGLVVAMALIGPMFFSMWTAGKIAFDGGLFAVLVVVTMLRAGYNVATAILIGVNRHGQLAIAQLTGAVLAIALAFAIAKIGGSLLTIIACSWIGEVILIVGAWRGVLLYLDLNAIGLLRDIYGEKGRCRDLLHRFVRLLSNG